MTARKLDQPIHEASDGSLFVIARNNGMIIEFDGEKRWAAEEFTWTAKKVSSPKHAELWYAATSFRAEGDERSGPNGYFHVITNAPLRGGLQWDHIDGNGLNNRGWNLRAVTASQNLANRRKSVTINGKPPSSQYLGVDWHTASQLWRWRVKKDGVVTTGYAKIEVEAALAYNECKRELFGENASINPL